MAIKPAATLMEEFEYISIHDDCWDKDADGFKEAWERYLEGTQIPPMKEGAKPTVFRLRPMASKSVYAEILDMGGFHQGALATVAYCVVGWTGHLDAQGNQVKCERIDDAGKRVLSEASLDSLEMKVILDLANRVYAHAVPSQT